MMPVQIKCAVIGKPIKHSLSPVIHELFAKQAGLSLSYEKIEGDDITFPQQVLQFFYAGGRGLNVTLPFKQQAFNLSEFRTPRCEQAKAANTLWMDKGELHMDNTDGVGFIRAISAYMSLTNKTILIIGAGGAACGIIGPLFATGVSELWLTNRTMSKAQAFLNDFPKLICQPLASITTSFDLIVNATSAGLFGEKFEFMSHLLASKPFCYDLAYNLHQPTPFVSFANDHGCQALDGLEMLIEQAAEAFFIWHGFKPETHSILPLLLKGM